MVILRKLLAAALLLSAAAPGAGMAQHARRDAYTRFVNLSARDGLAAGPVYDMLMDRYGAMWFAGPGGLTRYDGSRFTIYRAGDGSAMPGGNVTALAEDAAGGLWVGTDGGLARFDRPSGLFERFTPRPGKEDAPILALHGDGRGFIWVETPGGCLDRLDIATGMWSHASHTPASTEGDCRYHFITGDSRGNIWIGGHNQALVMVSGGRIGELREPLIMSGDTEKRKYDIRCVVETRRGEIVVGNKSDNLLRYDTVSCTLRWTGRTGTDITCAVRDDGGRLWFGGCGGLEIMDDASSGAISIRHDPADPASLASDMVYRLYRDPCGRIWIGTDRGVSIWSETLNAVRHYRRIQGMADGMSSDDVTALMQDRDGLLWIGTAANGTDTLFLAGERFGNVSLTLLKNYPDRHTFVAHRETLRQYARHGLIRRADGQMAGDAAFESYEAFRSAGLRFTDVGENRVSALCQDSRGGIYIGLWSFAGFNVYDKRTGAFSRHALWGCPPGDDYPRLLGGNPFGSNWYTDFLEDGGGNFWCATWEGVGLNLFDRDKGEFSSMHYMPGDRPGTQCRRVTLDPLRGRVLAAGKDYYGYCDPVAGDWMRYAGSIPDGFPCKDIFERYYSHCKAAVRDDLPVVFRCSDFVLQRDTAWLNAEGGVVRHVIAGDAFTEFPCAGTSGQLRIAAGGPGRLWLADDRGDVFRMDAQSGRLALFTSLKEWVTALYEDGQGVLWAGTGGGLRRLDAASGKPAPGIRGMENLSGISCVVGSAEAVYVAHRRGIAVASGGKRTGSYDFGEAPGTLPGTLVRDIHPGRDGTVWACTDSGLARIAADGIRVYGHDPADGRSLPDNDVTSACEDGRGGLWAATPAGIWKLDIAKGEFTEMGDPDGHTLASRLVLCLAEDSLGRIWVGTDGGGVSILDRASGHISHLSRRAVSGVRIAGDRIAALEACGGAVWIASEGGLDRYDLRTGAIRHIGVLDAAGVTRMAADHAGSIWAGGRNSIGCVSGHGEILIPPSPMPGLPDMQFDKAACLLADGRVAFGGYGGFCVFDPATLLAAEAGGKIAFSGLMVNGAPYRFDPGCGTVALRHSENSFTVDFGGAGYEFGGAIRYRYKLEGFDNEWNEAARSAPSARYTNLPPGRYTLRVEASDALGRQGAASGELIVRVATPWYRQWWFFMILAVAAGGGIAAVVRFREGKLRRDKARLETLVGLRTAELSDANGRLRESEAELRAMNDSKNRFFGIISHDLRNPLRALDLTAGQLDEQYDALPDGRRHEIVRTIRQTAGRTGALLDSLLLWTVSQMGMIKPNMKPAELRAAVDAAVEPLRLSASGKGVDIRVDIPCGMSARADANLLQIALRNLAANAVHYSHPGGAVEISALCTGGTVEISVTDHGAGIPLEHLGSLFTPGAKRQTRGTAGEQGAGLGLIIVREFIHLQGGQVRAESAPGKGSTFIITLQTDENDLYTHC